MILGIECTAHTFGVGVCHNGKVLANVRDMYKPLKGGIIPNESANHHRAVSEEIYSRALEVAGISEEKIEGVAFSNAPGLAPCLVAGMNFAKKLALRLKVPVIEVNHCVAHLEIGQSVGARDAVLLYASGANTQIISFVSGKYRVFGETLDSGVGNTIDKFARHCGIPFPGGPEIEKLAIGGKYVELPYSIKGMDVSFSGIETKLRQLYDSGVSVNDLAFSLQETVFAMLVEASERALAHTGKKELVLGGGVACNSRLQEMCRIMCKERGAKCFIPSKDLLIDNPAMIAFLGEKLFNNGDYNSNIDEIDIYPRQRTDEVEIKYK